MREQKGYLFHKGQRRFVRYCDGVLQSDGTIKRKLVCKKLDVGYGGEYRTHSFRRGLATNLHALGVDDKTIQAILRHSNVGLTMNVYVKSVSESQVNAMDALGRKLEICNDNATTGQDRVN